MGVRSAAVFASVGVLALLWLARVPTLPKGNYAPSPAADWSKAVDDPKERLILNWRGNFAFPSAKPGTWIQRRIEDRFNVSLKPVFLDGGAYKNRLPLMYAGGNVPDVNWDGDPLQLRRNIREGYVTEIPYDLIRRYAPTYMRTLNGIGKEAWLYSRFEGKNYGLPTFSANGVFSFPSVWRGDWLREAGIAKVPETLDEMHEAFLAFRKRGPTSYGMCPATDWPVAFVDIFVAFDALPQDFVVRDGKVVWGGILPEAKQALTLLRKWYAEGLIDPDFSSASAVSSSEGNPLERKFRNGATGYYYAWANYGDFDPKVPGSRLSTMRQSLGAKVDLQPGKPLVGPDGKRRARVWGGAAHVLWFGPDAARHPEKIVRVLRMLETFATDRDAYLESRIGKRGEHWEWSPERGVYLLPPYDEAGVGKRDLLDTGIEGAFGYFSPSSLSLSETRSLLPAGADRFRETYANPAWGIANAIGKSDVAPSAGRYLEDLRQFQTTTYVGIIRGDLPLDSFDGFTKEWLARGGQTLTDEANAARADAERVYAAVGAAP
ncbi:extracellular solute-binding protein [bacterium]|nr:MAG: extracellular solute-binding protein [bacterium]